jgi:hypothetical protein
MKMGGKNSTGLIKKQVSVVTKIKKKTNSTKAIIFIYDRFTYKALKWYKQHVRSIHDCPILQDSHF